MTRAAELALALASTLIACRPAASEPPREPEPTLEAPPPVDHGPTMPYAGTWIGPKLRLEFAGRWVLVEPAEPAPGQAPLELRVVIERREGEFAFALQTSIAGAMPVDFLRPGDWTMLVEDGALALAMGDEPLERYERVDAPPTLIGPALVDPATLPEALVFERAIACLEFAGSQCASFEAEGPRAVGCREALWAACVDHPEALIAAESGEPVDERASAPMLLAAMAAALRWSAGLEASARDDRREPAKALRARVLAGASTLVELLGERGALPQADPSVEVIRAHLHASAR
ncbi:hypothetical protein ACNOYE_33500 [Nannocystaceae bacterium ST9]